MPTMPLLDVQPLRALTLANGAHVSAARFSAAAEDTRDSYLDGACLGSVVGIADARGHVLALRRVPGTHKVEGVAVHQDGSSWQVALVTDADDPARPGWLLRGSWTA